MMWEAKGMWRRTVLFCGSMWNHDWIKIHLEIFRITQCHKGSWQEHTRTRRPSDRLSIWSIPDVGVQAAYSCVKGNVLPKMISLGHRYGLVLASIAMAWCLPRHSKHWPSLGTGDMPSSWFCSGYKPLSHPISSYASLTLLFSSSESSG